MKELYYKYAKLLLERGLCIKKNEPLVINAPIESIDFIRVLTEVACSLGINDIYYDWYDDELKHTQLLNYDDESIKNSRFWNKEIHDEYAKKGSAFLFLVSSNPSIMNDIDSMKKLREVIVTGCCTDICVLNLVIPLINYFDENNKEVNVVVREDLVETYDAPYHNRNEYNEIALKLMRQAGAKVEGRN